MELIIIAYIAEKLTIIMKWNENEMIMKWKWLFFMKFVSSHSRKGWKVTCSDNQRSDDQTVYGEDKNLWILETSFWLKCASYA